MIQPKTQRYVYILLRKDLSPSMQIIQASHACLEAAWKWKRGSSDPINICLLALPSENALLKAEERLQQRGISTYAFYEPDDNLHWTCLCTEVIEEGQRQAFKKYQLWGREEEKKDE